jgi:trk system potassium uptake protein TrkH
VALVASDSASLWIPFLRRLEQLGGVGAVLLALLEFGMPVPQIPEERIHLGLVLYAGLFLLRLSLELYAGSAWRSRLLDLGLALVVLGALAVAATRSGDDFASGWLRWLYVLLAAWLLHGLGLLQERLSRGNLRPALFLLGSLAVLALLGALLLMLPGARAQGTRAWTFEEAFFTAASAVSVTGLSVRDVGTDLSFRGQVLLLALIQIGGLGLVALIGSACILERGKLRIRELRFLGDAIGADSPGRARRFLAFMLAFTIVCEALGAWALMRATEGVDLGPHARWWWCVFHSVSAFCNAGFGLSNASLIPFAAHGGILWCLALLVIAGGLGFGTHRDLLALRPLSLDRLRWVRWKLAQKLWWPWRKPSLDVAVQHRLSLHTRLVLVTSALLLGIGMLVFRFSEAPHSLKGAIDADPWLMSFFHSAMARTAGFNALDLSVIAPGTLFVLIVLMAIGASPVSTGGGLKTTTVAVAALAVRSMARNREQVEALGRSIPRQVVNAAMAITLIYGLLAVLTVAALLWTQPGLELDRAAFEGISALATVGWSVGVTAEVSSSGHWILAAAMLIGRIGPMAVLLSFAARRQSLEYRYPEAPIQIG